MAGDLGADVDEHCARSVTAAAVAAEVAWGAAGSEKRECFRWLLGEVFMSFSG